MSHDGFTQILKYPLISALFNRRSRRISKGIKGVKAGSLSYESNQEPQVLDPIEEALLILATGLTGLTMPDMPFQTKDGKPLVGSPMLQIAGRSASSPDNAQATHFFMINDTGTYFLQSPEVHELPDALADEQHLIDFAEKCKIKILDSRLDFPRKFPCYIGRNRYVSNLPGTTIFFLWLI